MNTGLTREGRGSVYRGGEAARVRDLGLETGVRVKGSEQVLFI